METGPFPDARRLIIVPVTRLDLRVAPLEPNSPHSVDLGTSSGKNGRPERLPAICDAMP